MIGKYTARVDDKGRLFVPAKLRAELGETFYVTLGFHGSRRCLTVYTSQGWAEFNEQYNRLPPAQKAGPVGIIFSDAVECTPDRQFRFLLSANLYQYAGIDRDVIIVGQAGQAEIWDAGTYADYEREMLTPENLLAALEAMSR